MKPALAYVSTPWTGLLHFYQIETRRKESSTMRGVNALNGLTSFLPGCCRRNCAESSGVNALNGLTSFLRIYNDTIYDFTIGCQRPERAYFISTDTMSGRYMHRVLCQRPERAYFISTARDLAHFKKGGRCQRPERAYFISTAPNTTSTPIRFSVSTPWTGLLHFYGTL